MVCAGFTSDRDEVEITELSPLCVEGRVIYAAPFDPALERPKLTPALDRALPPAIRPAVTPLATPPASLPDKRLFLIGIAAGVIAALALAPNNSNS